MKKYMLMVLLSACLSCLHSVFSQSNPAASFKIVPLGVRGGSDESNLSAYMLAAAGSQDYICLDAGTLHYGIEQAIAKRALTGTAVSVLKNNIKGYLISHPHLDHVAGLIINSPDDTAKNIYAFPFCLEVIREKYFSWKSWANFGDEGEKPTLNKYHYTVLSPLEETPLARTPLFVKAFYLSHGNPYKSTAFLIRHNDAFLLYLGDTGADTTEHADNLQQLWQQVAPLIKEKKLKAIFIETSFDNKQPDKLLFGHLTPRLLMQEMNVLAGLTGASAMIDLPVVITHEKPGGNRVAIIQKELLQLNTHHLKLIFPVQGKALYF